ncbi:MAG: hypothetical protein K6D90_01280 [Lachnospiraceae bacterium]|nr:hypothetical protein [Lachnospiraceae bacterium]
MSVEFETKVLSVLEQIYLKFDEIDKRFEQIDKRFEEQEQKFELKFIELDKKIESRTDMLMQYIYENHQLSMQILNKVNEMDERLQNVETIVKQRWQIPELSDKVDVLYYEVEKHTERLNDHDRKLAALAGG